MLETQTEAPAEASEPTEAVGETTESSSETSEGKESESFVSSSQKVSDALEGADEGQSFGEAESKVETSEPAEPAETGEAEEAGESQTSQEPTEDVKEVAQKRIDKLIAESRAAQERADKLEAEIQSLKTQKAEPKKEQSEESPKFTKDQLIKATKKFMAEDDADGLMDVFNYMLQEQRTEMIDMYESEKRESREIIERRNSEWQSIIKEYNPEAYAEESLKGNPDFDINNKDGQLYLLAKKAYEEATQDSSYWGEGGMRRAVQDSFKKLLLELVKGKKDKEPKKKTSVKKERKAQLNAGADDQGSNLPITSSKDDETDLKEYMKDRKAFKSERMATSV